MSDVPVLTAVEAALVEHFGQQPQRASISFVGVPPIEVLRFEPIPGERAYVSLGMSRQPMTAAVEPVLTMDGPRAELVLELHDPTDEHAEIWRRLAVLAAAPVVEGAVLTPGMTVDLGEPLVRASSCTGVLVTESVVPDVATDVGAVAVLQAVPATSSELAWARVRGGGALLGLWAEAGTDRLDVLRRSVPLG